MKKFTPLFVPLLLLAISAPASPAATTQWTAEQASQWYAHQPWLIGCNYAPSTAVNELEMWQSDTFDLPTIDRELGWAQNLGFNTARVFLHNLPWKQDAQGYLGRIDQFLATADKHHIKVMFVLLDAVWDPYPKAGKQPAPTPGLHNSHWVQAPGREILEDHSRWSEVEQYVKGVVGHFRDDRRILAWDLFNEPDNPNRPAYNKQEPPGKTALTLALLKEEIDWARSADPSQPLTTGVWIGNWGDDSKLSPMEREQLDHSDVISFHNYGTLPEMEPAVEHLRRYRRPVLCTEYMARPRGSTFEAILPYLKEQKVAAYNWGFVAGKSNTIYPWDSWEKPYPSEPKVWFHDIFRTDGTPYDPKEVAFIRKITGHGGQ
jgi:hypothetical protein